MPTLKEPISEKSEVVSENNNKKRPSCIKTICKVVITIAAIVALVSFGLAIVKGNKNSVKNNTSVSSQLKEIVGISQLSTADFVYNGIAEKRNAKGKIEVRIAYNATVKAGVNMDDIEFDVDEEEKTITVILPEISIYPTVADANSMSFIPKNPNLSLRDALLICQEDVTAEAAKSERLFETAEQNLKAVIEALTKPLLENMEYTLVWGEADISESEVVDNEAE